MAKVVVEQQNCIIENRNEKNAISWITFLVLTMMYMIAYNETLRAKSILWYGISVLAIGVVFFNMLQQNRKIELSFFTGWALTFFVYCALSAMWALDIDPVFNTMKTLLLVFVVHILLAELINTKADIKKVLWANFFALLFTALFIIFTIDISTLGQDRLGSDGLGELWNANDIGLKMCVGAIIASYFLLSTRKNTYRLFVLACMALFVVIALFTGSRKVVLLLAMVGILIFFLKAKRHRLLVLILGLLFAVAFYQIILNIESLYNVLGKRLEDMIDGLFKGGTKEDSFNTRAEMISMGLDWFLQRPLFGYGLSNFSVLYGRATGWTTYSHNNFVEILVSGGLIGFTIYYAIYIYIVFNLLKPAFKQRDLLAIVLFSIIVSTLVLQIAMVSFSLTLFNCLLCLGCIYIKVRSKL